MAYTYSSESEGTQEIRRQRERATTSTRDRLFGVPPPPPRPANMAQQNPGGPPAATNWAGMDLGYDDFDFDQFIQNVGLGGPPVSPIAGLRTPSPPSIPSSIGVGSTPVPTPAASTGVGVGRRRPIPTPRVRPPPPPPPPPAPQATSTPIRRPPITSAGKEPRRASSRRLHRRLGRRRATNTTTTTRTRARRTGANAFPSDSSHGSSSSSSNTPSRGNRLNQAEIRRQLQRLSTDQIQAARGRRIAGVTTTNTITTTYKDGGTPTVSRSSSSSRS